MKFLVIINTYPLPANNGSNMRTLNFVRYFNQIGSVDLFYKTQKPFDCEFTNDFSKEYYIQHNEGLNGKGISFKRRISRCFRMLPWDINENALESGKHIVKIIESGNYDVILVRYIHNTANLFKLPAAIKKRVIVDFDDIISEFPQSTYTSKNNGLYSKIRVKIDRAFLKSYEESCLLFGAALFCSEDDRRKMISRRKTENCFVVPNVYQNKSFSSYSFRDGSIRTAELLFVGALNYKPNVDGLLWFIHHILPALRAIHSAVRLHVVGRSPSEELKNKIMKCPSVELHADVRELMPYYEASGVVIVPLLSGGGTRIKILEAGMARRPVLSTPIGAYGLSLRDGRDILLFTDKDTFISRYKRLCDRKLYTFLANNLQDKVVTEYSTANFESAMNNVLRSIVNN